LPATFSSTSHAMSYPPSSIPLASILGTGRRRYSALSHHIGSTSPSRVDQKYSRNPTGALTIASITRPLGRRQ
jgi:hypothetical protein